MLLCTCIVAWRAAAIYEHRSLRHYFRVLFRRTHKACTTARLFVSPVGRKSIIHMQTNATHKEATRRQICSREDGLLKMAWCKMYSP
jgi:hypothetical protein